MRLNRLNRKIWLLTAFMLLLTPAVARAQGVIFPEPIPEVPNPNPLRVEKLQVEVNINDNVANTHVTQVFRNPYDHQMEGTFVFPLPKEAVISAFSMWIDGEKVAGELLEKEKATRTYEDIVRRVKDPALLEYVGRNTFRVRIFPIPARSDKKVELEYSEVIPYEGGLYKYLYPLKAAQLTKQTIGSVSFGVNVSSKIPITNVFSPTHKTDEYVKGPRLIAAGWEAGETAPDRDFILFYGISDKEFGVNLAAYRDQKEDGYFMLLLSPKRDGDEERILPKDVVFVFDRSGSMGGEKIKQAKAALDFCLNALNERDRFGLITFSTDISLFRSSLAQASKENIQEAVSLLDAMQAAGGTNINDALLQALDMIRDANMVIERMLAEWRVHPTMIVFLTDGLPTVGETDVETILKNVAEANGNGGPKARIFAFGVGNDVNTRLLDDLAAKNRGVSQYVREDEDIELAVSSFFTKVSRPVLSNLKLDFGRIQVEKMYPREIPELFAGTTLTVFGRYQGEGESTITLTGETEAIGMPGHVAYEYRVEFPEKDKENNFLPRLWASRRIGYLLDEVRRNGESSEVKDEIIALSLKNGIMTPYTSYLVLEPNAALRRDVAELQSRQAMGRYTITAGGPVRTSGEYPDQRPDAGYAAPAPAGPQGAPGPTAPQTEGAAWDALKADTGAGAVAASEEVQAMKGAEQVPLGLAALDDANTTNLASLQLEGKVPREAIALQQIEDKVFVLIDSTWTDIETLTQEPLEILQIQYLSDAYFEALTLIPDLGPYFAQAEKVTLRLNGLMIQIVETQEGGQTLTEEQRGKLEAVQPEES